jgi:hypothetical protein
MYTYVRAPVMREMKVYRYVEHEQSSPRISGCEDFVYSPEFEQTRKHRVTETGSVSLFR